MIFKNYLQYKTNKLKRKRGSEHHHVTYEKAQSVGILFTNSSVELIDKAEKLSEYFKKDGKKVKIMAYEPSKEVNHLPFDSFSDKDISFWGNIRYSNLENFLNQSFDFLCCIDDRPNLIIEHLIFSSKAKCKVGKFSEGSESAYDLMVAPGSDADWIKGIHTYMSRLN